MEHGKNYSKLTPKLIEGELEWEIESILDSQCYGCKKRLQYLIKWVGYPKVDSSWELAENVHALRLIQKFQRDQPTATKGIRCENGVNKEQKSTTSLSLVNQSTSSLSCLKHRVP